MANGMVRGRRRKLCPLFTRGVPLKFRMKVMKNAMKKEARYLATVSLGVMGAGFAATLPFEHIGIVNLLQGGFEAGVVGGLADWFAVSALFRHPLGLPIPHTALLPRNRDKMTKGLVSIVEQELLSKETIRARLAGIRFLDKSLELAERELHTEAVQQALVYLCEQAVRAIEADKLVPLLEREIQSALEAVDSTALVRSILEGAVAQGYDTRALDFVLGRVEAWAIKQETRDQLGAMAIKAFEGLQTNGFMAFAVNAFVGMVSEEKLGSIVQSFILAQVEQLRYSHNSRREAVLGYVRAELAKLPRDSKLLSEVEGWMRHLPERIGFGDKLAHLVERVKDRALAFIREPEFARQYAIPMLVRLLASLRENPHAMERGEAWIQEQIAGYLEQNHGKIGQLVKENLDKLDNEKLIELVEEKVGKDLQWIRVNGAICGFVIGVGLTGLKWLV